MDGLLKSLVATACLVVIAAGAYYFWSEYDRRREMESRQQAAEDMARSARILELELDGCRSEVDALLKEHEKTPITNVSMVPARLLADLKLCLDADVMYPFERSELQRTGLLALLQP